MILLLPITPLIAKLIVHQKDRATALQLLQNTLEKNFLSELIQIHPFPTKFVELNPLKRLKFIQH
nr:hypothetical protein [Coxiella-like endosymbiont of Rhipicephalus sanguineus]